MTHEPISPLGGSAESSAARRYARSERYREQHDRLAPYRVIASAVIIARGAKGLTQKDLGALVGTTGTAISRAESGRHPVSLETLSRLGSALGISFGVGAPTTSDQPGSQCIVPEIAVERSVRRVQPTSTSRQRAVGGPTSAPTLAMAAQGRED
jgi:transcriptional regulator with XRE-family HTH domain